MVALASLLFWKWVKKWYSAVFSTVGFMFFLIVARFNEFVIYWIFNFDMDCLTKFRSFALITLNEMLLLISFEIITLIWLEIGFSRDKGIRLSPKNNFVFHITMIYVGIYWSELWVLRIFFPLGFWKKMNRHYMGILIWIRNKCR